MDFITIDFETANYDWNSAISVGLVRFIDDKPVDSVYSLIRPPRLYILPRFYEIHRISCEDVKDAPTFDVVWKNTVLPFVDYASSKNAEPQLFSFDEVAPLVEKGTSSREKLPLVAHNANFDKKVLLSCLDFYKIRWNNPNTWIDSLEWARKAWPNEKCALTKLAQKFGIEYDAHNALADSLVCGKILLLAKQKLES